MSDCKVTVKVTKDGVEKCSLEGEYLLGVIVKVRKDGEKLSTECTYSELGTASTSTRVKAVEFLSLQLEDQKKKIVLDSLDFFPQFLRDIFKEDK